MVLLQGFTGWRFLTSEVHLYRQLLICGAFSQSICAWAYPDQATCLFFECRWALGAWASPVESTHLLCDRRSTPSVLVTFYVIGDARNLFCGRERARDLLFDGRSTPLQASASSCQPSARSATLHPAGVPRS